MTHEGHQFPFHAVSRSAGRFPEGATIRHGWTRLGGKIGDANKVSDFYNWSIDELMLAAELGFDGIGTNEHHQNPYGFMCNPNLFGAILARMTRDQGLDDVALVQLGATLAATSPPIRIAEEYAVLDCISGGRLVAGVPLGLGSDANISYGVTPMEQRERWREAHRSDAARRGPRRSSLPGTANTTSCRK